jgi:class 3 adenylate cyclase/DNA-binding response OmpR family regulator
MSSENRRVLVFEDSDIFADMLIEYLKTSGYNVERAINGFEGIKQVYTFMPHLIVTDVEMPLLKGYQATRLLKSRKSTKAIPIIMFTSLGETKDKFWGNQAGADAYIEKSPDNFEKLNDAIKELFLQTQDIDFAAIERESKRINDQAIIEMVNNLLDNKLVQTTIIGMLAELSGKADSMDMVVEGIFDLLHNVCEAQIVSLMIRGTEGTLYEFTANFAGYTEVIANDFAGISVSDFNSLFPDFRAGTKNLQSFFPSGNLQKQIESYVSFPLSIAREKFASVHIANSIKEYFSPAILENINVFLAAASPVIANALSMLELSELQQKTRAAFARYVPPDVMDEIIKKSSKAATNSEYRNVVVLFADIRSFTTIVEHSSAQAVVEFLNAFFAKMGNEIISENGHIDKFIGDAIMAVFGAFRALENAPSSAIRAALKMLAALDSLDTSDMGVPKGALKIGIGINWGECVLGNIGFHNKMDYTLVGDNVNLASRLEGVTKVYRHPLIVSEYMYNAAKDNFLFRKIDNVRVKGKKESVGIYAVYMGFVGQDTKMVPRSGEKLNVPIVQSLLIDRELLSNYDKGVRLFYMREWKPAQEYFAKALKIDGNDYLSQMYYKRSEEFSISPPPDDWDFAITLTEK